MLRSAALPLVLLSRYDLALERSKLNLIVPRRAILLHLTFSSIQMLLGVSLANSWVRQHPDAPSWCCLVL